MSQLAFEDERDGESVRGQKDYVFMLVNPWDLSRATLVEFSGYMFGKACEV